MESERNNLYRKLPQVGEIVDGQECRRLLNTYPRELVAEAARTVISKLRDDVKSGEATETTLDQTLANLPGTIEAALKKGLQPSLRPVINATGVILQTNLGRAPLSAAAIRAIDEVARGYCNLEMELDTGERGRREIHIEELILRVLELRGGTVADKSLSGRAALVVNNCAAATLLALNSLAEAGEVIVSRGELVEIGGGFRIPEILRKSGAVLREVGTTNRTRIADYAEAITPQTRLILRVHRSNFSIEGFTERPSLQDLVGLGARTLVPVFEDQGTGCIASLAEYGIRDESSWVESASAGSALVASSGDKLLGGPQCGILVGTGAVIEALRTNPLYRALRVDKLTYAALEATLFAYLRGEQESVPTIAMLAMTPRAIEERCNAWVKALDCPWLDAVVFPTRSLVGGGTTPGASLPSFAVALRHAEMSEGALAARLRQMKPPVVARTSEGRVLLDLRTVPPENDGLLIRMLQRNLKNEEMVEDCKRAGEAVP